MLRARDPLPVHGESDWLPTFNEFALRDNRLCRAEDWEYSNSARQIRVTLIPIEDICNGVLTKKWRGTIITSFTSVSKSKTIINIYGFSEETIKKQIRQMVEFLTQTFKE